MPYLGNFDKRNAIFRYFTARILKILLSYLKSTPWIFPNCKILQKNKNALNCRPKMPYLGIF